MSGKGSNVSFHLDFGILTRCNGREPFHSDIHRNVTTTPTKPLRYVGAPFNKAKLE